MATSDRELVVLRALRDGGSMTQDGVAVATNTTVPAISPRFRPLANKQFIRDTGRKEKSLTSNRQRIIWEITPEGVAYVSA
jgi:hypothetical protein